MSTSDNKIAVIGMACRFPGAKDLEEYWNNLILGKETIKHFSDEELNKTEYDLESLRKNPDYVRAKGILNDIDKFDAGFFGMTPTEAAGTDPQHRVWLETAWNAFENAGCDPITYHGAIGVFAGGYTSTYLLNNILRDTQKFENYIRLRQAESYQILTANDISFISTKTAYKLNLRGPAINVQTACSTSLVAIVQACQSLFSFESDICLAGGVCITVPQESGYVYQEGAILSPDGHCRPFDSEAKGTVPSNGVGAVILKRLEDAVSDHDKIYAVVSGWALNNDGSNKVSFLAPSVEGQAEVIMMAQSFAGISPEDIGYIEAHGTGTQLGDPIEIAALTRAFFAQTEKKQFCGIGSVKSNIGHTDAAAGVASFIKACLSAYHKKIPASLCFSKPNPHIDFENSPFFVQRELREWNEKRPLIIGTSSFGIGGTNSHVIIEEPPREEETGYSSPEWPGLLLLSAKSEYSLDRKKEELIEFLKAKPDLNIIDVAHSLGTGRNNMLYRSFIVGSGIEEIISGQNTFADGKMDMLVSKLAFMFPGQGAQYISMGESLYKTNGLFRNILDDCFRIFEAETGKDIKRIIFENNQNEDTDQRLAFTDITQPALFIIEYALTKVLEQINIKPDYLIGHSIGEYTAACIAGVFDMQTALKIVIKRGQLMRKMPSGNMMAVRTSIDKLKSFSNPDFEIAADNAPSFCTISFKSEDDEKVKRFLENNDIQFIPLKTSHAFHSATFDPIISEFAAYVNQFTLNTPDLPFISCLTGTFITPKQAISGHYWASQLRNTVLFRQGISEIARNGDIVFLEVGPETHLTSLVKQSKEITNKSTIVNTLGKPGKTDERYKVLAALGNLFNIGININFTALYDNNGRRKISLPNYPFERIRHWIDYEGSHSAGDQKLTDIKDRDISYTTEISASDASQEKGEVADINALKIVNIWKSLFGLKKIGLNDNFFEIGGHSLLALQILARIKEIFGINISLKEFLNKPTIGELVSIIEKETGNKDTGDEFVHLTTLTDLPLSSNQKRLWTISQFNKFNPAYNVLFTYHLAGDLNINVFNESMNILFNRHHIMFSSFKQKDGIPWCEITPKPVHVEFLDFSGADNNKAKEEIHSFIGIDSRRCFDIEIGPLYRLYLLKVDNSNYYFHATINHLIFDGWSWGVFVRDFNSIYNSLILNDKIKLEKLEFQHYDYAKWQESAENKTNEEKLSKFWINYLKDCPAVLNFPYDRSRKDISSGLGGKEYIKIPAEYTDGLKMISKKENTTLFVTLLSAFGVLLNRYSGEQDICIGTPVANRPQARLENIFGMFVNTIVIRLNIEAGNPFNLLVSTTRNSVIEAISNLELPFEKIVEAVKPDRSFNTNPLFQTCFAWQNNLSIPLEMKGLEGNRVTVEEGVSPFDLTLYMWENGDFIEGEIEYNIDILDRETIKRLRENFLTLLRSLINNPESNVASLNIISEEESKRLNNFKGTFSAYPREKTIVKLFEDQVKLYPDKTAIIFKGNALSYKQLNERTNQLARTLRDAGVVDNIPVAVLAEKSLDMIIGILGILKAGGGYVPIDPEYPEHRINFIISDSGSRILLLQEKYLKISVKGVTKINLNLQSSYNEDSSNLEKSSSSEDMAYIMYTSGTTGIPKGSIILQHSVVRLVRNINYMDLSSEDKILLTGAIVFDATTFEIWGALLNGGTLYLVDKETILNPKALGEELQKNDISILWLTSPLLTQIAESRTDIFSKLKYLLSGGDILSVPHINKVRRDNPGLKVINCYGPTENTTFSTTYLIEKDFSNNIPIGKPISNSTTYIFDGNMNYQPIGVIGELYVGGDGLSKGYLNREDLTKKSFIDNPLIPGEKLYRTGDYARWLPDGNIEFHGRIDNQLKIRGFRVEIGEVEAVISETEGVIETVIKPLKIQEGDIRLAAFLNVSDTFSMDTDELSKRIKEKLPPYMIPSFFKFMNGFPKTVNGKIDKGALNVDINQQVPKKDEDLNSITETEKIIYEIWCEALKTKDIATIDNFFEVGGNSLLAISVFSKIESAFKVDLGLRVFFDGPRIKDLAEIVDVTKQEVAGQNKFEKAEGDVHIIKGEI